MAEKKTPPEEKPSELMDGQPSIHDDAVEPALLQRNDIYEAPAHSAYKPGDPPVTQMLHPPIEPSASDAAQDTDNSARAGEAAGDIKDQDAR